MFIARFLLKSFVVVVVFIKFEAPLFFLIRIRHNKFIKKKKKKPSVNPDVSVTMFLLFFLLSLY